MWGHNNRSCGYGGGGKVIGRHIFLAKVVAVAAVILAAASNVVAVAASPGATGVTGAAAY